MCSHSFLTKRSLPLAYSNDLMAKPFVKWAGGKRQLLDKLTNTLPQNFGTIIPGNYAEPFVGGGAMMFKLFEMKLIEKAVICASVAGNW